MVKLLIWVAPKENSKTFEFDFNRWWSNPLGVVDLL